MSSSLRLLRDQRPISALCLALIIQAQSLTNIVSITPSGGFHNATN